MKQRGMSLIEIMIALVLASIVSAFVLMITRSQLVAYEQNDQVTRMQQNERAGVAYVETLLRRACGGIGYGEVGINVGSVQRLQNCVKVYDGAVMSSGTYTNSSPTTLADAVEIIYGTTPMTTVNPTGTSVVGVTAPVVIVANVSTFANDDYVIVTDFNLAGLFRIQSIDAAAKKFTLYSVSTAITAGTNVPSLYNPSSLTTPYYVMKAQFYSIHLESSSLPALSNPTYYNMLMVDSQALLGTDHSAAQPVVENVFDFQLSMARDDNKDGNVTEGTGAGKATDDYFGNVSGELPLPLNLWNDVPADPQPRWIRTSFTFRTGNSYPGFSPTLQAFEDRTTYTVPNPPPRFRQVTLTVAPRMWNLKN